MTELSIDEINIGIEKCYENSSELIDDGNYLRIKDTLEHIQYFN